MASINAFRAISPNPKFADQLVLAKPQAQSVAGTALPPLKTLLETGARLRPETPEGQAAAFAEINETLKHLVENHILISEEKPGIYIYEVEHPTYRQTGVWAAGALSDYTNGTVKTHELTFGDSVRRLRNYRESTGLEGSPVLLTYPPNQAINRIIATAKSGPHSTLGNHLGIHRLWKIEDITTQQQLINAFVGVPTVYLADGHHRSGSAIQLAALQQLQQQVPYQTLSSLFMSTDELRIKEYDRVVVPEKAVNLDCLLEQLSHHFYIRKGCPKEVIQPNTSHHFGMCYDGNWYHLQAKPHTYANKTASEAIDAAILQQLVLDPIFGITDPKTDPRLRCAGGEKALTEIGLIMDEYPDAIAFTLCPLTVSELLAVADAGEILPPKSTWIDPKVPYGLLLHQHQPQPQ